MDPLTAIRETCGTTKNCTATMNEYKVWFHVFVCLCCLCSAFVSRCVGSGQFVLWWDGGGGFVSYPWFVQAENRLYVVCNTLRRATQQQCCTALLLPRRWAGRAFISQRISLAVPWCVIEGFHRPIARGIPVRKKSMLCF